MDVGPQRDLVGDFANAVRNRSDLIFGLYHSMFEWFHPLYKYDRGNLFLTNEFARVSHSFCRLAFTWKNRLIS